MTAMTNHAHVVHVQEYLCGALGISSYDNAENRISINKCGRIDTIITAMADHAHNVYVQEYGFRVLGILVHNDPKNRVPIYTSDRMSIWLGAKPSRI